MGGLRVDGPSGLGGLGVVVSPALLKALRLAVSPLTAFPATSPNSKLGDGGEHKSTTSRLERGVGDEGATLCVVEAELDCAALRSTEAGLEITNPSIALEGLIFTTPLSALPDPDVDGPQEP